ncbi:MAG: hypothetical protein CO189_07975 [candidate division Zixibacteria bacterium CG_4_9_14_3_um_filter_46_8]|nr:MAG: hypothetical protein CO189_07975 [candidate division Zixibacteria bacterium CG_4_9_14_3_um_filter_46_8]
MAVRPRIYFILVGFYSVSLQTLLLREFIADFAINELIFGIIFFIWLMGGAIGSLYGLKSRGQWMLNKGFYVLIIMTFWGILMIKFAPRLLGLYPTETVLLSTKLLIALIAIGPASIIGGILFTGGFGRFENELTADIAYLYELFGFTIGGLICSLAIFPYINNLQFIFICFLIAAIYAGWSEKKRKVISSMIILGMGAVILWPPIGNKISELRWNPLNLESEFDTPYGRISATTSNEQSNIYFDSQRIETIPDYIDRELRVHLPAIQLKEFDSALIIGGNPYSISRELYKYGFKKIDSIIIDQKLLDIYQQYSNDYSKPSGTLNISIGDARAILTNSNPKYDLILLCGQEPLMAAGSRYFTKEFFAIVNDHLQPDGIFSFAFQGAENVLTEPKALLVNSISKSLDDIFRQNSIIFGQLMIFIASKQDTKLDISPAYYTARLDSLGIQNRYVNKGYIADILSPFRQMESFASLRNYHRPWIYNSDNWPVAYFYSLFLSEEMLHFPSRDFILSRPEHTGYFWVLAFALILMLVWLPSCLISGTHHVYKISLAIVGLSGFSVMLLELISIYLFQIAFGSVYTYVALIISLFMTGSIVGLIIGKHFILKRKIRTPIIAAQLMSVIIIALLFSVYALNIASPKIVGAFPIILILAAGLAGGVSFVGVTEMISTHSNSKNPASAYGYELYGAGLGAMMGAPIMLPILGINSLLMLILALNAAVFFAILLLLLPRFSSR